MATRCDRLVHPFGPRPGVESQPASARALLPFNFYLLTDRLRRALFLRFYGRDFSPESRRKILEVLGHEDATQASAHR
ncbi:MAG: hypothetical protein ACREQA_21340 [Candidatus Binatia bacterium]